VAHKSDVQVSPGAAVREANGIRILLQLLQGKSQPLPATALTHIRALSCRVVLGLVREPATRHILAQLQVRCSMFCSSRIKELRNEQVFEPRLHGR
jgi:hypothetical protein